LSRNNVRARVHYRPDAPQLGSVAPNSPCGKALRMVSYSVYGSGDTLPDCMNRQCQPGGIPVHCDPDCPYCGKSNAGYGITIGPGNGGCPIDPPTNLNNNQGNAGAPIGVGETVFHETLHWCGFGAEPSGSVPQSSWFRLLEWKCYGWRDTNAPPRRGLAQSPF
jgi:hypothetical protein